MAGQGGKLPPSRVSTLTPIFIPNLHLLVGMAARDPRF
jgi:hypothetical protein